MAERLHQGDRARQQRRQQWAARHRSPTPETVVRVPPQQGTTRQATKTPTRGPTGAQQGARTPAQPQGRTQGQTATPQAQQPTPLSPQGGRATAGTGQTPQAEDRWDYPSKVVIPLPGGARSEVSPPPGNRRAWKVSLAEVKDLGPWLRGAEKGAEKVKRITRNIPTPFYGLALHLGVESGAKAECKAFALGALEVEYDHDTGQVNVSARASASMGVSVWAGLRAGVSGDLWLVEAGVGLKAKLIAALEKKAEAGVFFGYNLRRGGMPDIGINLDLTALEIALKGAVSLFCYYDAVFVSTYEKTWTLYERTLGKFTLAGVKIRFSTARGLVAEPQAFDIKDLDGNIRSLFPSKS